MEAGHDEKTNNDGDDAEKLDVVVRADAMGDVVGNFLVKNDAGAAGGENEKTKQE